MSHDYFLHPVAWLTVGLIFGVIEVLVPGYLFLGFATGAIFMSAILFMGAEGLFTGLGGLAYLIAFYAAISLASWFLLRKVLKAGADARKVERDINEDPYKGAKD
ncbi:hypothetical protein [Iodidimonas sp. SYSU 1G8]|uniref:NfeD family protein n=1 Tax=Iodidimonas sp. SYSU 1G8 TaxID=3133967 RepID=UPI0031FF229D